MSSSSTSPSSNCFNVTPSDSVSFSRPVRQLYVGTSSIGNVSVLTHSGTTVVFNNVSAGVILGPFYITRVNATGTTATNIVAFE